MISLFQWFTRIIKCDDYVPGVATWVSPSSNTATTANRISSTITSILLSSWTSTDGCLTFEFQLLLSITSITFQFLRTLKSPQRGLHLSYVYLCHTCSSEISNLIFHYQWYHIWHFQQWRRDSSPSQSTFISFPSKLLIRSMDHILWSAAPSQGEGLFI